MLASDDLPFTVNLWSEDELRIEAVLATAASLSIGRAAFDMATISHPDRTLSLIGPGTLETRSPLRTDPGNAEPKRRSGWTTRKAMLKATAQR